jgi:hypothetical protein
MPVVVDINNPADSFSPLESTLNVVIGEMPATFVTFSGAMRVNRSEKIFFLSKRGLFRTDDPTASSCDLDSIGVGAMLDRSDSGNEEVTLVGPESVEGSEMLIWEPLPAFPPEFS